MEKLIRFINEYGHTSACGPFETYRIEPATEWYSSYLVLKRDDNGEGDWKDWHLPIPRLISKEYGFIKWLVENDKIDTQNLITYMRGTSLTFNKVPSTDCVGIDKIWNKFYTEVLLMLLSISDTPIEDLLLYLK